MSRGMGAPLPRIKPRRLLARVGWPEPLIGFKAPDAEEEDPEQVPQGHGLAPRRAQPPGALLENWGQVISLFSVLHKEPNTCKGVCHARAGNSSRALTAMCGTP